MSRLAFKLWFVLCICAKVLSQEPITNIPQGRIVGIKAYVEGSITPVEIYYGVPYATAPKGRYRFSAPERHTGWRRTFFAHRMPPHCPYVGDQNKDNFSEDCLFLNIWTPRRSDGKPLPVVVILHNESWARGGITLPCQELASEGIVVVTVMFRLNILAFFNLRSVSARGNLALLDQYMALLWVRNNIAAFDGDPTAITILGHSAGADSVLHQITSPRSLGLFQRAIMMSPFDIWQAINEHGVFDFGQVERTSREMAHSMGCNSDIDQEIMRCMRERPLSDILSLFSNETWMNAMQPIPDTYLPDTEQFLPNSVLTALSAANQSNWPLDILLGSNDLEALNYNDEKHDELIKRGTQFVSAFLNNKAIPEILRLLALGETSTIPTTLIKAIRWEYWNEKSEKDTTILNAIEVLGRIESSATWNVGIAHLADRLVNRVRRLYAYRYSQPAGVDLRGLHYNFTGAVHGSDLVSLLGDAMMLQVARRPATTDEKQRSFLLRKNIINFIKYGSPDESGQWQRYKKEEPHIYDIRNTDNINCHNADKDSRFWIHYIPELSHLLRSGINTEQLVGDTSDSKLRGGVFAMCGVAVVLLLLLCVCAILLRKQNSRRFSVTNENNH